MEPTIKEAADAVSRRIGLDPPRIRAVARELADVGRLPIGTPANPPRLSPENVVDLLVGSTLDVPLRAVADEVGRYRDLTPGGAELTGGPASIPNAGRALDILASLTGANVQFSTVIVEIVTAPWREIVLLHESGEIQRFGAATHWRASGHRKSIQIAGAAFAQTFRDLFSEEISHV